MGLEQVSEVKVRSANGVVKRSVIRHHKVREKEIRSTMTGSDRNDLECPMLIGRDLLREICLDEEE